MGKTEVTQGQWYAVMGENPSSTKGASLPVERVSWNDILEFLDRINGVALGGYTYRLPTEAEWEYACRAGTPDPYGLEEGRSALSEYAWFTDNAQGQTQPVASKNANGYGLYDMLGNVYEWTSDVYAPYDSVAVTDHPDRLKGNESEDRRVLRGSSIDNFNFSLRCAYRVRANPDSHFSRFGFRLVALPPPE